MDYFLKKITSKKIFFGPLLKFVAWLETWAKPFKKYGINGYSKICGTV